MNTDPISSIEEASKEFETAREIYDDLKGIPIEGSFDERVQGRTSFAMAEVRFKRAAVALNTTIKNAVEAPND